MSYLRTFITFLRDEEYRDLIFTTIIVLTVGTIVYHYLEGWSWIDCIYFSVITLSTIGYGDFSPQTTGGKIFTIFYILVGIGIILSFINTVYRHYEELKSERKKKDDFPF